MKAYIEQNRERFLEELFTLLRIPSVSAKPEHQADMYRCAETLADLLLEEYEVDRETALRDAEALCAQWKEIGIAE